MATDEDKQIPEPDPWAGLDSVSGEDKGEDFEFSFDGLDDGVAAHTEPVIEPPAGDHPVGHEDQPVVASIHADSSDGGDSTFGDDSAPDDGQDNLRSDEVAAAEVPLAVFPPPDAEVPESEMLMDTGRSGIISMADATDDFGGVGDGDDAFDDKDIAHELGLLDVEGEAIAAEALASGDDLGLDAAADFGEPANESPSDDVSFDAGMMGNASPFSDSEQIEPVSNAPESWQDDSASIPLDPALAMAGAAVAATGAAASGAKPAAAKKKGSGLGQMVGVVLGGLMALPITYAILIWGFQKDPFKLGKQVPTQLAFLLPQKLQPGYKPPKKAAAGPSLDAAPSLDDLPSVDEASSSPASETADIAAADPADPADPADGEAVEPTEPMQTEAVAGSPAASESPEEPAEPTESAKPASDDATLAIAADTVPAVPATAPVSSLAALAPTDALAGIDALVADTAIAPAPAPPATLPPLDLTGVEMAAERATQALDALGTISDAADPARDRLLVVWYKRLAQLGEEIVRLETMAADSGRPLASIPTAATDLFDRICVSDGAVADLDRLGRMWLTSQKRRADGVALVATLDASRQVGPYWSTRVLVSKAQPDGSDRSLSIISRSAPPADAGERVVIAGVMFDGDAVWAADMRPVASEDVPPPASDFESE